MLWEEAHTAKGAFHLNSPSKPALEKTCYWSVWAYHTYLAVSGNFSRFLQILHMPMTTASELVLKLVVKLVKARFACAVAIVSDNGRQFVSSKNLQRNLTFCTSHLVRTTLKEKDTQREGWRLQRKFWNRKILFWLWWATGIRPAELIMGRKIKALPMLETNLQPQWPDLDDVKRNDSREKQKQAFYFNRHYGARPLPSFRSGDAMLTMFGRQKARGTPWSFVIETHQGATLRRNHHHLRFTPASAWGRRSLVQKEQSQEQQPESTVSTGMTLSQPLKTQTGLLMTRSGRISNPIGKKKREKKEKSTVHMSLI